MTRTATAVACAIVMVASAGAQSPATSPQATRVPPRDPVATTMPATGSGRVSGRIVYAGSSTPIRLAQVTLTGEQNIRRMVTTDAEGRYEFSELPAGTFTVSAAKAGLLTLQYGQRRPFETGRPVTLTTGQRLEQIDFALPRGSVITGRITDRRGEPAIGAEIAIERYQYSADGQRRLNRVAGVSTNDLGEFRAFGLTPGEYVVSANLRARPSLAAAVGQPTPAPAAGYLQTYNPGTPIAGDAQPVLLGPGEEAHLAFGIVTGRMSTISGTIIDSLGRPAAGADLMLVVSAGSSRSGRGSGSAATDGTFAIPNVPPGEHFLQVRLAPHPDRPGPPENANVPVSVSGDSVSGVQIVTAPSTTLSGTVTWEGTAPRTGGAATSPLRVTASLADGRPELLGPVGVRDAAADGRVAADNSFRLSGVLGRVRLNVDGVPPGWTVKSITAGTIDLLAAGSDAATIDRAMPVRVVLSDKVTEVGGVVTNENGQLATDWVVVVLPAQRDDPDLAARYVRALRPDQRNEFRVRGLPPGQYVAAAVQGLEEGAHWDPSFQATLRNAATTRRFTLAEGQAIALTLDLLP